MDKVGDLLREKILIVDETGSHRTMTAEVLARAGYATLQVESTTRALEIVTIESPDLIILDSLVQENDGIEVCRSLKGDPFTNHIPILIFTSNNSIPDKVNSLRTGADGYLARPFTPPDLVAHVAALLKRSFYFDPLTKLPGAAFMHRQIDARLAQNQPTAILYVDLDHFRPYNQAYGHDAGDKVLVQVARLLIESLPARAALAGHLGADDFMAVFPPEGADTFAQTLVDRFRALQPEVYNEADYKRGSVFIENRHGDTAELPLMTLSAALVSNERRALINFVQASKLLSEVMRFVKMQGGSRWARDRRSR